MKTIEIKANIPEKDFMENILNMRYSGVLITYINLLFGLYSLTHKWHINKFTYYWNMLSIPNKLNKTLEIK